MSFDPVSSLFELGKSAIDKIWPDPIKRAEELRKLEEMKQKGDLASLDSHVKLMLGQIEVNKVEAKHKNIFIAGWRPFIGWVGGLSLAYQFILYPVLSWVWSYLVAIGYIPAEISPPGVMDVGPLMALVSAMLGVGAMRSFDKIRGVDTKSIR